MVNKKSAKSAKSAGQQKILFQSALSVESVVFFRVANEMRFNLQLSTFFLWFYVKTMPIRHYLPDCFSLYLRT